MTSARLTIGRLFSHRAERLQRDRAFDVVIRCELIRKLSDRVAGRLTFTFTVQRTHAEARDRKRRKDSLDLRRPIFRPADSENSRQASRYRICYIPNGFVNNHQRQQNGATSITTYNKFVGGFKPNGHPIMASLNRLYPFTDGTLSGGLALSGIRVKVERLFDVGSNQHDQSRIATTAIYGNDVPISKITRIHDSFARQIFTWIRPPTINPVDPYYSFHKAGPFHASVKSAYSSTQILSVTSLSSHGKATTHAVPIEAADSTAQSAYFVAEDGGYNYSKDGAEGSRSTHAYDEKDF